MDCYPLLGELIGIAALNPSYLQGLALMGIAALNPSYSDL